MKVLFIASNPEDQGTLDIERELTGLQMRLLQADRRGMIELKVLPALAIEELPSVLIDQQPDVLHIAAHGTKNRLLFTNRNRARVELTSAQLRGLLGAAPVRPSIVFLNACTSKTFAKMLTDVVPIAIGMTAEISNPGAIEATAVFYEWLARGGSVAMAHQAADAMLQCLDESGVKMMLFLAGGPEQAEKILVDPLRILVAFESVERRLGEKTSFKAFRLKPDRTGHYRFNIGVAGCPTDMTQLVIFTDDETYIESGETLEKDLCLVSRDTSVRGSVWTSFSWPANGDTRLFATVATGSAKALSTVSTLIEGLERYYFLEPRHKHLAKDAVKAIRSAMADLRANDGTQPNSW